MPRVLFSAQLKRSNPKQPRSTPLYKQTHLPQTLMNPTPIRTLLQALQVNIGENSSMRHQLQAPKIHLTPGWK